LEQDRFCEEHQGGVKAIETELAYRARYGEKDDSAGSDDDGDDDDEVDDSRWNRTAGRRR